MTAPKDQNQEIPPVTDGPLMYKGKPLIRKDNVLYYGFMDEKYIAVLQIMESRNENGLDIPTKVIVTIQYTSDKMKPKDKIIKTSEKPGLYAAMDIASIWLDRMLASK